MACHPSAISQCTSSDTHDHTCRLAKACNPSPSPLSRLLCCAVHSVGFINVQPYCFVVLQVPQECPQVISDVVAACTSQLPVDRPTAQQIIYVIESSMADTEGETSCVVGLLGKPSERHL